MFFNKSNKTHRSVTIFRQRAIQCNAGGWAGGDQKAAQEPIVDQKAAREPMVDLADNRLSRCLPADNRPSRPLPADNVNLICGVNLDFTFDLKGKGKASRAQS